MSCVIGNKDANVDKALKLIEEAANRGAKVVLLQELFNTEYVCFRRVRDFDVFRYAEPIPGATTTRIGEAAKRHGIYVIAPIFEKAAPGVYYNTAPVIDPHGRVIGKYRKTHIPAVRSLEKLYFRPGSDYPVFKTDLGTLGIVICYDRLFPENWRIVTLEGAEIVFVPTATLIPQGEDSGWEPLLRTRAYENKIFVVGVNRVGKEESTEFYGKSMIVDPWGRVLAKTGGEDAVVSATIDLDDVDRARIEMPVLRDLRPEIYGRLTYPSIA